MKKMKKIKRIGAILLIFLLNINSFAAIVSDNDGSAFVTKAEFDALKKSFSSQIEEYNTSIDRKIDGAIASYLAGIQLSTYDTAEPYISGLIWSVSNDYRPRYKYAPPQAWGDDYGYDYCNQLILGHQGFLYGWKVHIKESNKKTFNDATYGQSKLWIKNLKKSSTSGLSIAAWVGYDIGAKDEVDITHTHVGDSMHWSTSFQKYVQIIKQCNNYIFEDTELKGNKIIEAYIHDTIDDGGADNFYLYYNGIKNHYGKRHMDNIVLFGNSVSYDCFSNYDETKNWCYKGSSENLYQTIAGTSQAQRKLQGIDGMFETTKDTFSTVACLAPVHDYTNFNPVAFWNDTKTIIFSPIGLNASGRTTESWVGGDKWYLRGAGFETKYLTNFNQLYNPNLDSLAEDMVKNSVKGYNTLLTEPGSSTKHIGIQAGLPIVQLKNTQTVQIDLKLRDILLDTTKTSSTYGVASDNPSFTNKKMYIWAKKSPFTSNDPNSEADLEITGSKVTKGTGSSYDKGYLVESGSPINIKVDENCIVWLKWSIDAKKGGGVLEIPDTIGIISEG